MLKKTFLLFSLLILLLVLFWGFSQVREQQASPELTENESLIDTESSSHSPEEADSLATTTTDSALRVGQALGSDTAAKILNRKRRLEAARGSAGGLAQIRAPSTPPDSENYAHFDDNPVKHVSEHPVSTFSIDVDTGAYANVRRMLNYGQLPPHDAVRVEEMINYFAYDYPLPDSLDPPFKVTTEIAPTAWNQKTHLLHIGIKGYNIPKDKLPPANLVFLVDVSGSMQSPDKLELLKSTLKLLTQQLTAKDKVSLVVYAGATGLVLEPTQGNQSGKILAALERLSAGGSTNGGAGIRLAYAVAEQAFIKNGINRVLLATDGDFNVGTVNFEALKNIIEEKRKTGISLTTLGFGTGNYNDHLMEQLADAGNGNYAYIDNLNEAQKVLVNEMSSTLNIIAKDVKMNVTPLRYFVSD
jgi:Ca-activated chloride channel family protein